MSSMEDAMKKAGFKPERQQRRDLGGDNRNRPQREALPEFPSSYFRSRSTKPKIPSTYIRRQTICRSFGEDIGEGIQTETHYRPDAPLLQSLPRD